MGINIYTIKHPLVLNWMNHLIHNKTQNNDRYELISKISLALVYEACRKILKNKTLYIRYMDEINEIWLFNNVKIDLFSSNINILQIIGKDIKNMVPNLNLYFTDLHKGTDNNILIRHNTEKQSVQNIKSIILLEETLQFNKITSTLQKIYAHKTIKSKVCICCCYCNTTELDKLSQQYSSLEIYTGQITDNKIFN